MSLWDVMVSIFWFTMLMAWFWLLIVVVMDIFRDTELSGGGKALWCLFVIVLPWLGVLSYLLVRGRSMNERAQREAERQEASMRTYVRAAAAEQGPSLADELSKLSDLRNRGVITPDDYDLAKSRLLGQPAPSGALSDQLPPQQSVRSS